MKMEKLRCVGLLVLAAFLLATSGCWRVKQTPYQSALKGYYGALQSERSEESLKTAIANVDREISKSPTDPGMLALRAGGYLDLLRLGVQKPNPSFDASYAEKLFRDLRLLKTQTDQATTQHWLRPRANTMVGDAFLLRAESLPTETEPLQTLLRSARQEALYQLAADFYQHAWVAAQGQPAGENAAIEAAGLAKEMENARDGYVNAISGVAKTKRVLGFTREARQLTQQAIGLVTMGSAPLPAPALGLTPTSLYSYSHAMLQTEYESMETLTKGNYEERVSFAQSALKEELSSQMLKSVPDVNFENEQIARRLLTYYGALESRAQDILATGGGDVNAELVSLKLIPGARNVSSGVGAVIEYVSLVVGEEKVRVDLDDAPLVAGGLSLKIHSGTGSSANLPQERVRFLNRVSSLFAPGRQVQVLGPGENVLGTVVAH